MHKQLSISHQRQSGAVKLKNQFDSISDKAADKMIPVFDDVLFSFIVMIIMLKELNTKTILGIRIKL